MRCAAASSRDDDNAEAMLTGEWSLGSVTAISANDIRVTVTGQARAVVLVMWLGVRVLLTCCHELRCLGIAGRVDVH